MDVVGIPTVLLKGDSTMYTIGATCTHQRRPFDEGTFQAGGIVQCLWYGSCFHLCDGSVVTGLVLYAQSTVAVRVQKRRRSVNGAASMMFERGEIHVRARREDSAQARL